MQVNKVSHLLLLFPGLAPRNEKQLIEEVLDALEHAHSSFRRPDNGLQIRVIPESGIRKPDDYGLLDAHMTQWLDESGMHFSDVKDVTTVRTNIVLTTRGFIQCSWAIPTTQQALEHLMHPTPDPVKADFMGALRGGTFSESSIEALSRAFPSGSTNSPSTRRRKWWQFWKS